MSNRCKQYLSRLLVLLLCVNLLGQNLCLAADVSAPAEDASAVETVEIPEEEVAEEEIAEETIDFIPSEELPEGSEDWEILDDPALVKLEQQDAQESLQRATLNTSVAENANPYTGIVQIHNAPQGGKELLLGVDVSHHQTTIDWNRVKAAGVEHVMIRCGYTGYGLEGSFRMAKDTKFETFIKGAHDAGLRIGIYYFSQATSKSEAQQEAAKTIELLKPYKSWITLPVYCDYEPTGGNKYRIDKVSYANATTYIAKFCQQIEAAGYKAGYYSYREFLNNLNLNTLSKYNCWVAQFAASTAYAHDYEHWQYSSSGSVDGITGKVDCDFWYHDTTKDGTFSSRGVCVPSQVTTISQSAATDSSITLSWKTAKGAVDYDVYYATSSGGTYKRFTTVSKKSCQVTGLSSNKNYFFKIVARSMAGNAVDSPVFQGATVLGSVSGLAKSSTKDTSVALKWTALSGAKSYQVSCALSGSSTPVIVMDAPSASCTVSGLQSGTKYDFTVSAVTDKGVGVKSAVLTVATTGKAPVTQNPASAPVSKAPAEAEPKPTTKTETETKTKTETSGTATPAKPAQVTNVKVTATSTTAVKLSWAAMEGVSKYQLWYAPGKSAAYIQYKDTTATSLKVSGLDANTEYYFKVRACNDAGWGSCSAPVLGETAKAEQGMLYTNVNVNLRQQPNTDCTVLDVVPQYKVLNVVSRQTDDRGVVWYKVLFDGQVGYLSGRYCTVGLRAKTTVKTTLRKSAKSSAAKVATVAKSGKVMIRSTKKVNGTTWYRVEIKKSGKIVSGYAKAKYFKKY